MNHSTARRVVFSIFAVGTLAAGAAVFAGQSVESGAGVPAGNRSAQTRPARGPNLEGAMKSMARAFDGLRQQVGDASKNESSLKLVLEMQQATITAKAMLPGRVNRMGDGEKAKAVADYRAFFIRLLRQQLELEEQLATGENAKAATTLAAMEETEKKAHDQFDPPKKP